MLTDSSGSDAGSAANGPAGDGQTVKRPGHDHDAVSVADGAPLKETPNPHAVSYQGKPVVQACNLLTIADLNQLGVYYAANPLPNIVNYQREYIAADGAASLKTSSMGFSTGGSFALNSCSYSFVDATGDYNSNSIGIAVSQPSYVPGANTPIGQAGGHYVKKPNIGNVQVYSERRSVANPGDAAGDAVIRIGDLTVSITFNLAASGYAGKLDAIATTIANNLQTQAANPTGTAEVTYDSPAFPQSVAQPCKVLTPEVFASAYHTEASPLVVEQPATAVGLVTFNDPSVHSYVTVSCSRNTGDDDPGARKNLVLQTTSYLSAESAKQNLALTRQLHPSQDTATTIGEDSFIETSAPSVQFTGAVIFRKGRFVFELHVEDERSYPKGLTADQANSVLVPAAQRILRNFGNQN
jgi:hypothetical protein